MHLQRFNLHLILACFFQSLQSIVEEKHLSANQREAEEDSEDDEAVAKKRRQREEIKRLDKATPETYVWVIKGHTLVIYYFSPVSDTTLSSHFVLSQSRRASDGQAGCHQEGD